ncbi:MAG: diacylglycerol kinase family protein, partial [Bacilli bacterium]|nr:diacylglycerol kinase family protein [Bacilli bacterium]
MKNYLLFNPYADGGKGKENAEALLPEIAKRFENPETLSMVDLDTEKFMKGLEKDDNVVMLGGDGTLNHFINKVDVENLPCNYYLYPSGTGNDFLNDIKEGDKENEPFYLLNPYLKKLPIVEIEGKKYRFINGIGYGIDGQCCVVAEEKKKKGEKVDYGKITVGLLFKGFTPRNATIKVDGGEEIHLKKVYICSTMHGRFYGGGMNVAPEQKRNSGTLTLATIFGKGKLGTLLLFPTLFKGTHVKKYPKNVKIIPGKRFEVSYDTPCALQ